jgi:hypothetical protein
MRLAFLFSFLAVFSALASPASMLAEEVSTGKLGGVCNRAAQVSKSAGATDAAEAGLPQAHAVPHCDLCGTPGLVGQPVPALENRQAPPDHMAMLDLTADLFAAVTGLPFGRGPPLFLN